MKHKKKALTSILIMIYNNYKNNFKINNNKLFKIINNKAKQYLISNTYNNKFNNDFNIIYFYNLLYIIYF